jgi:uncharacterized membrane protein YphA (DoxX/SURF4 family)
MGISAIDAGVAMSLATRARRAPGRIAAGSFIFHSGLTKFRGDEMFAQAVHGVFCNTYPAAKSVPPAVLLRTLAFIEMTVGGLLLLPLIGARFAGLALTGYSITLLGMYVRTPGLHDERMLPTLAGSGFAKDIWLTAIGTSLVVDAATTG